MIHINHENISKYLRDAGKYLFIDKADIEPGVAGEGMKLASSQDWYFQCHFPEYPVMPGVFIMEVMMQTGALVITTMDKKNILQEMFVGCNSVRIFRQVRPGDIVKSKVELKQYKRGLAKFWGEAYVDEVLVAKMEFMLVDQDEMQQSFQRREKMDGV